MLVSEKSFLETLAAKIPGIAGYRDREGRRETDRRLREYLARTLDGSTPSLDSLRRWCVDSGSLRLLDDVGRIGAILHECAAKLRFADYGYAGAFDQKKIGQAELDRIYAYDAGLLEEVEELARSLDVVSGAAPDDSGLAAIESKARALVRRIAGRGEIFETVTR